MSKTRIGAIGFSLIVITISILYSALTAFGDDIVSSSIQKALLREDWKSVANNYEEGEKLKALAIMRAIKGQACLALNKNNESLEFFLSIANDSDREMWKKWAFAFAEKYPSNHVALYLKGDALARLGQWKNAVAIYTEALRINNRFAMALNARGVALVYQKNFDQALEDFGAACTAAPNFADAFASYGTMLVLKEASQGAIEKYNQAITNSSAFALVYNGRGCARIGNSEDPNSMKEALKDYISAAQCYSVKTLAESNIQAISKTVETGLDNDSTSIKVKEGMTLKADQFRDMDQDTRMKIFDKMNPDQLSKIANKAHENFAHSKAWGEAVQYLGADKSGLPLTNPDQSLRHADEHLKVFNDAQKILQGKYNINLFKGDGGATSKGIGKGYGDRGNWPVKTWFGLAQQIDTFRSISEPLGTYTKEEKLK